MSRRKKIVTVVRSFYPLPRRLSFSETVLLYIFSLAKSLMHNKNKTKIGNRSTRDWPATWYSRENDRDLDDTTTLFSCVVSWSPIEAPEITAAINNSECNFK